MKVYKISQAAFWTIIVLILVLPVSRHWRLLSTGERTRGTVGEYATYVHTYRHRDMELRKASEIRFSTGDSLVLVFGPDDLLMEPGREVGICYDPDKPSRFCLLTFAGFYSGSYTVLPVILLVFWLAFYHTFNRYKKRRKSP
jgi:hypothetical protein